MITVSDGRYNKFSSYKFIRSDEELDEYQNNQRYPVSNTFNFKVECCNCGGITRDYTKFTKNLCHIRQGTMENTAVELLLSDSKIVYQINGLYSKKANVGVFNITLAVTSSGYAYAIPGVVIFWLKPIKEGPNPSYCMLVTKWIELFWKLRESVGILH